MTKKQRKKPLTVQASEVVTAIGSHDYETAKRKAKILCAKLIVEDLAQKPMIEKYTTPSMETATEFYLGTYRDADYPMTEACWLRRTYDTWIVWIGFKTLVMEGHKLFTSEYKTTRFSSKEIAFETFKAWVENSEGDIYD